MCEAACNVFYCVCMYCKTRGSRSWCRIEKTWLKFSFMCFFSLAVLRIQKSRAFFSAVGLAVLQRRPLLQLERQNLASRCHMMKPGIATATAGVFLSQRVSLKESSSFLCEVSPTLSPFQKSCDCTVVQPDVNMGLHNSE